MEMQILCKKHVNSGRKYKATSPLKVARSRIIRSFFQISLILFVCIAAQTMLHEPSPSWLYLESIL
jgi:hypothetical protein